MIRGYNKSFLAKLVNYNDPRVESYADNLYEKIRQLGVLPSFVVRDKLVRFRNDIIDKSVSAPIFAKDDRFTFGYAYRGEELGTSGNFLNTGLVWDFEFELCFEDPAETRTVEFLNGFIKVSSDYNVQVGDVTFSSVVVEYNKVNHFRINRVHEVVELYVNKEYIGQQSLPTDEDVLFDTVYKVSSGIPPLTAIKYGLLYNPHAVQGTGGNSIISSIMDAAGFTVAGSEDYRILMLCIGGTNYGNYVRADSPLIDVLVDNTSFPFGSNSLGFNFRMAGSRSGVDGSFPIINTYGYLGTLDDHLGISYKIFFIRHSPEYGVIWYGTGVGALSNMGHPYRVVRAATTAEQELLDGTACAPYIGNDGKSYHTVKIGTQVWLADNLAETKFRNGDYIHGFDGGVYTPISDADWVALTTAGMCAYNNDWSNVLI